METTTSLSNTHPHLKDFGIFLKHLNNESDRGKVLISATMIDDLLLKTLKGFLIVGKSADRLINGFNAPLGTFSARIEASYAMGLINDHEYHDINIIRKIRNDFAHALIVSFDNKELKDRCDNLMFSAKSYDDVIIDTSSQFTSAAALIILNLTNRPHYVSKKRLQPENWPY